MTDQQLNAVYKILGIDQNNSNDVEIINLLFGIVEDAVMLRVGTEEVPKQLHWIVNEVVIKRFQLMGAEHLVQESIDVLSSTYRNPSELLMEYDSYFSNYLALFGDPEKVMPKLNKCRLL